MDQTARAFVGYKLGGARFRLADNSRDGYDFAAVGSGVRRRHLREQGVDVAVAIFDLFAGACVQVCFHFV